MASTIIVGVPLMEGETVPAKAGLTTLEHEAGEDVLGVRLNSEDGSFPLGEIMAACQHTGHIMRDELGLATDDAEGEARGFKVYVVAD